MCGICGLFEFGNLNKMQPERVRAMADTIRHRGPDDEGIFVDRSLGFGHRRLSIIDVAGGHQPMANEDETIWVLLNGEIYNYTELRGSLLARGHKFRTRSDTEAIVHLYEEYGESCFEHLRGMFAVAIWDSRNRKVLLARDRIGKKPLYYSASGERILFGSELKAVLAGGVRSLETDPQALSDYFSLGYIPAPKTIYRHVRKVLPGHYLVADANGVVERKYWDISFANITEQSEQQWCEQLREELKEAVRIRLMSEVPLGAFLSGGIDSSAVVAMMAATSENAVVTCSVGFSEQAYDERAYANQVAQKFGTEHHEQVVQPDALSVIDKLAWHYDEPFADSSAVPTYYVSAAARQHVTVALGGDGGDENFAGYRRYKFDQAENRLRSVLPQAMRGAIFGPLGRWYPGLAFAPRWLRAKATFQSLAMSPIEGYFNSVSIFRRGEKTQLLTRDFQQSLAGYDSLSVFRNYYDKADTADPLSRIQYVDMKTYLPDDIMAKVDRASMAVSLEVRAPLLDHKLMETIAKIPSSLKLRAGAGKYIMKKALEPVLPNEILYRQKQGFAIPLATWFRRELREAAYESIFSPATEGVINRAYLQRIWDEHQKNRFDRSAYLWAVLMFVKWNQAFNRGSFSATVGK